MLIQSLIFFLNPSSFNSSERWLYLFAKGVELTITHENVAFSFSITSFLCCLLRGGWVKLPRNNAGQVHKEFMGDDSSSPTSKVIK
jgi:hypothetical protein